jgi:hypothetical protein
MASRAHELDGETGPPETRHPAVHVDYRQSSARFKLQLSERIAPQVEMSERHGPGFYARVNR